MSLFLIDHLQSTWRQVTIISVFVYVGVPCQINAISGESQWCFLMCTFPALSLTLKKISKPFPPDGVVLSSWDLCLFVLQTPTPSFNTHFHSKHLPRRDASTREALSVQWTALWCLFACTLVILLKSRHVGEVIKVGKTKYSQEAKQTDVRAKAESLMLKYLPTGSKHAVCRLKSHLKAGIL